jgi:DNA-binding NtrC family response regulator
MRTNLHYLDSRNSQKLYMAVVDDEEDIVLLFRDALSHIEGIDVFGFTDSTLAFEHFRMNQSQYALVLSDYRIPVINRLELLKKVKAMKPSVKTLLISAYEINDDLFTECDCVDKFLQKPTKIIELVEAVEKQLYLD